MWITQHTRKIKTAATAATVRRLGAHTGTHKSTNKSISGKQQKSNEKFSVPCVSCICVENTEVIPVMDGLGI